MNETYSINGKKMINIHADWSYMDHIKAITIYLINIHSWLVLQIVSYRSLLIDNITQQYYAAGSITLRWGVSASD